MKRIPKKIWIPLVIVVVLVAARLAMPYFVTRYVNKVLAELPGYTGSIRDIDIHLYRGAYQVQELRIFKVDGQKKIPFIYIPVLDLSIEWRALFEGSVVGEVGFERPELNFIGGGKSNQSGKDVDWTKPIKDLMPVDINRLTITNGKIAFYDFTTKPHVDLKMTDVNASAENLTNATDDAQLLPSTAHLTATSLGGGHLAIKMKINVLKQIPDLDMDLKFEDVDLKALNDFFKAYAKIDVERGSFDLYTELAMLDGKIEGYVKPIIEDLKIVDWKKDKKKPVQLVWETIVGFVAEIFTNQKKDRFASRVPISGNIKDVKTSTWPALWSIFSNAFIKAFEKNTEGTIKIEMVEDKDTRVDKKDDKQSKKERRKERRKQRREERKRKKEQAS
ncbi:DUF748 domain-containing protein [Ohtaekwangia sp.]|uniref:DUF748 domain-containing protein n=1 Tax=Ohtaekwangia sp. TaxID=2066019 RepID=UPI002F951367